MLQHKSLRLALATALVVTSLASTGRAQCQSQKLLPSASHLDDHFGHSIDVDGDRLAVGAYKQIGPGGYTGAAYVFEKKAGIWEETAVVHASDGASGDYFGLDVAIDGDTLLVGAPRTEPPGTNSGKAYIFEKQGTSWIQTTILDPSNGGPQTVAGSSVALSGDLALLGAPGQTGGPESRCGGAFVFERSGSTWTQTQLIWPGAPVKDGLFGQSVAIGTDHVMIGADGYSYVYERTPGGLVQTQMIIRDSPDDGTGAAIAISGSWALISAPNVSVSGAWGAGVVCAYLLMGNTWVKRGEFHASDAQAADYFGSSLALAGSHAFIGMPADGATNKGAAYHFELGPAGWEEVMKFVPNDHHPDDFFGVAVALGENGEGFGGSTGEIWLPDQPGRVYSFLLDGPDCNDNGVPDACDVESGTSQDLNGDRIPDECGCELQYYCDVVPNSTGYGAAITAQGQPSTSVNDWTLLAARCPATQFGLFFYGAQQIQIPFGDGWRCVGGQLFRLPTVATDASGNASLTVDFDDPPVEAGRILPGSSWNFQFWYRDPAAGGTGFNLSDGMTATFCP